MSAARETLADELAEYSLRPSSFDEFIGQKTCVDNLKVFISAALSRKQVLDHCLFYGPPGLGKTTLAALVAQHMGSGLRITSGGAITRAGDLASQLTSLERGDVLFIDEIHRMPPSAAEMLYPSMEDFAVDIMVGEGPHARALRLDLQPFTLVGATTRSGLLTSPLRDRFGIMQHLEYYDAEALQNIIYLGAKRLDFDLPFEASLLLAKRARGTPRLALRLLKRVRDFVEHKGLEPSPQTVSEALTRLGIDADGLDSLDRRYLESLGKKFVGGPTGIETLSAALSEERDLIEDVVEPYLMQRGFIGRTARGRILTNMGYLKVGMQPPATEAEKPLPTADPQVSPKVGKG